MRARSAATLHYETLPLLSLLLTLATLDTSTAVAADTIAFVDGGLPSSAIAAAMPIGLSPISASVLIESSDIPPLVGLTEPPLQL